MKGEQQETGLLADGVSSCLVSVSASVCASAPAPQPWKMQSWKDPLFTPLFISPSVHPSLVGQLRFPLLYLPLRKYAVKQWPNAITQQRTSVCLFELRLALDQPA